MDNNITKTVIKRGIMGKIPKKMLELLYEIEELICESEQIYDEVINLIKEYKYEWDKEVDNYGGSMRLYDIYRQYGEMFSHLSDAYYEIIWRLEDINIFSTIPIKKLPGYEIWEDD